MINNTLEGKVVLNIFSKDDLKKALPPILSTISKCEKILLKENGAPQTITIANNSIKALNISLSLIQKVLKNYPQV